MAAPLFVKVPFVVLRHSSEAVVAQARQVGKLGPTAQLLRLEKTHRRSTDLGARGVGGVTNLEFKHTSVFFFG